MKTYGDLVRIDRVIAASRYRKKPLFLRVLTGYRLNLDRNRVDDLIIDLGGAG